MDAIQARQELARREIARRQSNVPDSSPKATPPDAVQESAMEAPGRFFKELTNPNPDMMNNVMSGGFAPARAASSALQPIYDASKAEALKMLPGNEQNWMLKGAEGTAMDLGTGALAGGIAEYGPRLPIRGLSLSERMTHLPFGKLFATEEGQLAGKAKQVGKNINLTESLLRPEDKEFQWSIARGTVYNPTEQAGKYISPSKNMTEVTNQLRLAEGLPMEERSGIYKSTKASPTHSHLNNLDELMMREADAKANPQANSATSNTRMRQFNDIRTSEVDNLNSIPEDELKKPEFWQNRKAYYQSEADKAGAYTGNEKMSARAEAYKALAQGTQDKTYALHESVKALNLKNQGLSQAKERASQLASVERGGRPKSVSAEIIEDIRPSKSGVGAAVVRTVGRKLLGSPVERLTKGISKSANKASEYQKFAEIIAKMKAPDEGALQYAKGQPQLNAPAPKPPIGLPSPDDFRTRDIKAGRLLPDATGSGPVIKAEGSSTINMPENLESDFSRMRERFGPPEEYPTPRISIDSTDIKKPSGFGLDTNRKFAVDKLIRRYTERQGGK